MKYRIIAPVSSVDEIEPVLKAGADEVYFGIMTKEWIDKYGNADFISRRQSELAHFFTYKEFSEIVCKVNNHRCTATLVLNSRYSEHQLPHIFNILEQWEARGGHSVMVSDIELLLWLNDKHKKLEKQLSVMAGVFNSQSAAFFDRFNVSRIVLPREMTISEIGRLIKNASKNIEFEAFVMFQKCEFIDSFCNFYHPCHEKHGCQMDFYYDGLKINHIENNDIDTPFCAACSLGELLKAGVCNFKIAGRGYPVELMIKSIKFIRQTVENDFEQSADIKQHYKLAFGNDCCQKNCYYK
jgi:collagenase-like PrtC family protease